MEGVVAVILIVLVGAALVQFWPKRRPYPNPPNPPYNWAIAGPRCGTCGWTWWTAWGDIGWGCQRRYCVRCWRREDRDI